MGLYETAEEANLRLSGTVFMRGDQVVECTQAYGNPILVTLTSGPNFREPNDVRLDDPSLNYRDLKCGYVNLAGGAVYLSRRPCRRYKQGLSRENVFVSSEFHTGQRPTFNVVARDPGFRDLQRGIFPSIEEACQRLTAEGDIHPKSVAIKREFALARDNFREDFILLYKDARVAFGQDVKQLMLPREYKHLKEICQDRGIVTR